MSILKTLRNVSLAAILVATPAAALPGCENDSYPINNFTEQSYGDTLERTSSDPNVRRFKKEVLESKIPVVVDFYTDWCYYCKKAEPIVKKLEKEYKGKVKFVKYNCEEEHTIPRKYGVQGYPTFIFYHKGKVVDVLEGFNKKKLEAKVKHHSKRKK